MIILNIFTRFKTMLLKVNLFVLSLENGFVYNKVKAWWYLGSNVHR